MKKFKRVLMMTGLLALSLTLTVGCGAKKGEQAEQEGGDNKPKTELSGTIMIDGSSTVFPISEAVGEEFQNANSGVQVTIGVSGTGGGFKKFTVGETDISNASRPIKDKEIAVAKEKGIEFIELPVAYDGLSVVVNKENDFVDKLTLAELKKIWEPGSKVTKWNQVRSEWPDKEIKLYGPGTDSGTFDYFTETVNGEEKASRSDYNASEDDNVLVQGIIGDKYSLGYFGFAYYLENKDKLRVIPIDGGTGAVEPTEQTINDGTYKPLSRPIFIYVSKASLKKPEVKEFVKYYLTEGKTFVSEVGYVPLPDAEYQQGLSQVEAVK